MPTLKFTVKNPVLLKEYLGKFTKIDKTKSVLLYVTKDSFVVRSFDEADYVKQSILKYSDVFNESEIDLDETLYVYIYQRLGMLISSIEFFQTDFTLLIEYKALKDSKLLKAFINDEVIDSESTSMLVGDKIKVKSKTVNIDVPCTQIEMARKNLRLTENRFQSIISTDSKELIYSFNINKEDLSQINNLFGKIDVDGSEGFFKMCRNEVDGVENVTFKSKTFEYSVPLEENSENSNIDVTFHKQFFTFMDKENAKIKLYKNESGEYILIITSNETQTTSICIEANTNG